MGGYLRALAIALAVPILNQFFMGLAGLLQLRSWSVGWSQAVRAASEAPLNYALVQAASIGAIFIVAFPHKRRDKSFLDALHVQPLVGGIVALCFLAGLLLQLPLAEVGNLVQEVSPISFEELARRFRLVNPTTWWAGLSALAALVIVAPVTEELLFRGWLLQDLKSEHGTTSALIWSSVCFGLAHLDPSAIAYATLGGLVLGAVTLRTKSTLAAIAMHAGINALPLLLPVTVVRIEGFNTLSQRPEHIAWWVLVIAICGAAATLLLIWRATRDQGS